MIPALHVLPSVRGVIQIGANSGQEIPYFLQFTSNLLLCEPLPHLADALIARYPFATVVPAAIDTTEGERLFYVASNNGESSSLLAPEEHRTAYPEIQFAPPVTVQTTTLAQVFARTSRDPDAYNVVVTDTQGHDLAVLQSAGELLSRWDLIVCEYMNTPLYTEPGTLNAITDYVAPHGFQLVHTAYEQHGAGDALFLHDRIRTGRGLTL